MYITPLKPDKLSFTIHYGEIKTKAVVAERYASVIFTIHYGEIKTMSHISFNDVSC